VKNNKRCFLNMERPCDLTCKAAFEVDDPIDNVDCHFLSLAYNFGEGMFELKNMMQGPGGGPSSSSFPGGGFGPSGSGPTGGPGPAKGPSNN
jgi:hypothetical protein